MEAATVYAVGRSEVRVPARTALVGNPSDGFGGMVVSLALDELGTSVVAEPALAVTLEADGEELRFADLGALVAAGRERAYPTGGPLALLMAAAIRFAAPQPRLCESGVSLRVADSSIPPGVGLAGSSAIVIGALQALGRLFGAEVGEAGLPGLALACERDELGIEAGLQDRVVQTYGGLLFMDFSAGPDECRVEPLDADRLPTLFVAWLPEAASDSGAVHAEVRKRHDAGDARVRKTMREIAALARRALRPLMTGDAAELGLLMERNLELRGQIYDLDPRHLELAQAAGSLGLPANYTGSGGAIVGLFSREDQIADLREALATLDAELLIRR
jgi:glucuronokinase